MNASGRPTWIGTALLAGAAYFLIGRLFALPVHHAHAWRMAAWAASAIVYAAHIGYEHLLRHPPLRAAVHVALGVAIGAFALAIAGMVHSLATTSAIRPTWLLALVLWPALTGVPALLGALFAAAVLTRLRRSAA